MTRILFILCILVLTVPALAQAEAPGPQTRATLEASYPMDDPVLPPIPPGYQEILLSPGFENEGADWHQYNVYPQQTNGLVHCGTFACEGECYAWLCAKDYCTHDVRQPLYGINRWTDVHIDYVWHIETQELPDPERDYADWADLLFLDTSLTGRMVQYVRGWGNWEATYEWVYEEWTVDTALWPDWVVLVFRAHTDARDWTGFYLDGIRMYGIPPYRTYLPRIVR